MEVRYLHDTKVHNTTASREVVPIVMELTRPRSVVDVGCGTGTWLTIFGEAGVPDVLGVDGDYLDRSLLCIAEDRFVTADLTKPFGLNRRFDLVVSLEVAEHLPEEAADVFVQTLVSLGDTILFSAAVPGQGGQNHLNEQWPAYWQAKFARHGYAFHDVIRKKIWDNERVDAWYRQNTFLVRKAQDGEVVLRKIDPIVHPETLQQAAVARQLLARREEYIQDVMEGRLGVKENFKLLVKSLVNKLK